MYHRIRNQSWPAIYVSPLLRPKISYDISHNISYTYIIQYDTQVHCSSVISFFWVMSSDAMLAYVRTKMDEAMQKAGQSIASLGQVQRVRGQNM